MRYHLFDIDAAVGRGLVYGIMTLLLGGCYALFVTALGLLGLRPGVSDLLPSVGFFALVAAAFVPLWTWVRARVDRLIYHDRYDYARTLRDLGIRLASIQPFDDVLSMVAERVTGAMYLTGAAILLRQDEERFVVWSASGEFASRATDEILGGQDIPGDGDVAVRWVPLVARGEVRGYLVLGRKRSGVGLSARDVTLLETLAAQAAVAVENALLVDRLREKVDELELLRDRLLHVQEEERKRVAQAIHDDILAVHLQMLSRIEGAVASLADDGEAVHYLRQGIEMGEYGVHRLREACAELYPTELKHYGLVPALAKLVDDVNASERFEVIFSCDGLDQDQRLPADVEDALYTVARQALDNTRRHADPGLVEVRLVLDDGCATLVVRDDGRGFDRLPSPASLLRHGHLGLVTLRERAEALSGTIVIVSGSGTGTEIRAEIPVPSSGAREAVPAASR